MTFKLCVAVVLAVALCGCGGEDEASFDLDATRTVSRDLDKGA
jgi:hypothetical protein